MDETEVEIEIACWIQGHPEADASMIQLRCASKRGTFALMLGNLAWSIEVPLEYRANMRGTNCKWKESEIGDPSNDDTFKVSIVKNYWNKNDLTSDLGVELQPLDMSGFWLSGFDGAVGQEINLNIIINSQQLDQYNCGQSPKRVRAQTDNFDESMGVIDSAVREGETLTDVLDFVYSLAMLYQEHQNQTADIGDDNDATESNMTSPWKLIAKHAYYAHEACKRVASAPCSPPVAESEEDIRKALEQVGLSSRCNSPSSSPTSSSSYSYVSHFCQLKVDSPTEVVDVAGVAAVSDCSDSERYFGSDSESSASESGWVMVSADESDEKKIVEAKRAPRGKRKAQKISMQSQREPSMKRPSTSSQAVGSRKEKYQALADEWAGLKWCNIEFDPVSCSVECLFRLSEFMNPAAARALGFNLEHPLRVEIVPNKVQVESFSWRGDVEVYVSHGSDYHNHVPEEEMCGSSFVVPNIVQAYFHQKLSNSLGSFRKAPEEDLFIGVIKTVVKRLTSISAGESCCVCGRSKEWQSLPSRQQLWACMGNLCQATYESWQSVTSSDIRSRKIMKRSKIQEVEQKLRDHFTFFYQDELRFVLDVYGVNTKDMSYDQMISALTRIESWNENDTNPESGLRWIEAWRQYNEIPPSRSWKKVFGNCSPRSGFC